ncbi:MAG TPA: hypothetical protein VF651_06350 [Gammaproteobacteria bacterium]
MAAAPEAIAMSAGADLPAELVLIAQLCGGQVQYINEGERRYIHMTELHFYVRGEQKVMDALLCLNYPNPTYPTKLYLPTNLGLGLNWNENAYILAKQWFTWSWKDVSPNQPPIAILAEHLRAFR